MNEYIVTDPRTGRKVRLTGDSPPTEAELEQIFSSLPTERQPLPVEQSPLGAAIEQRSMAPLAEAARQEVMGGNVAGMAYGAAKPFIGLAQLGIQAGERFFGTPEGREPLSQRVAGGLQDFERARAEAGGSSIPVIAGQMLPFSAATRLVEPAKGFVGRAGQAFVGGGMAGAVEPVTTPDADFGAAKTAQIATGTAVGPATSLLGSFATTLARRFNNSFLDGANLEAGRLANELAGDRRDLVVQSLRQPQPTMGATVTAAQAAAPARSAEFSALGRRAAQVRPSEFEDIAQAQNRARAQELSTIAGTPDDIAAAERARSAATEPLYQAARQSDLPVDSLRTVQLVDRLIGSRQGRPQVTNVLNSVRQTMFEAYPYQDRARDSWNSVRGTISSYQGAVPNELDAARRILNGVKNLDIDPFTAIVRLKALRPQDQVARDQIRAAITNLELPDQVVTQNANQLINASRNISDLLEQRDPAGRKINQAVSRELLAVKRSVDRQIAKSAPEFGQAQSLFADLSKPIDRMRVGQYIQDRLIPAINDAGADAPQRATVFANAMRDMNESVRQATGYRRAGSLEDLMTPDEIVSLQRIGADLARDVDVQRLAGAGQRRATEAVGEMFSEQAPNALSRPMMIINAILRRTGAGASERTMNALAIKMQDPAAMADIMDRATAAERRAIERGIMLYITSGAVSRPDDAAGWAARTIRNLTSNDEATGLPQE
jgi:hypothetical protein